MDQRHYALILGAMKSGTTSLYLLLTQHPGICACTTKEPEFFSRRYAAEKGDLSGYETLWPFDPSRHRYALEASIGYSIYPFEGDVAANIKHSGIQAKFIYIVRNPFNRILSAYNFSLNKAWHDPTMALSDERYIAPSRYYSQLAQYLRHYNKDQILVLDFDTLREDPSQIFETVTQFLGLPPHPLGQTQQSQKNITTPVNQWQYLTHQNHFLRTLKRYLPSGFKQFIQSRFPTKAVNRAELTETEKTIIKRHLADDMRLFKQHFNFPVEKWGF